MSNESERDLRLRAALRETLDREWGPDPRWVDAPAARRIQADDRRSRGWPLRLLAVAAVIGSLGAGAALLAGRAGEPDPMPALANGWIAYTVGEPAPGGGDDLDIWFVRPDQEPRRVVGSDEDDTQQLCPAFSPDGRRLAYGVADGHGTAYAEDGIAESAGYLDAALVVADVDSNGRVTDRDRIDLGDGVPPPCPLWSPDGERIAFGLPRTSPINPERSAVGSEVLIVRLADGTMTVLPDLLATDLEWSPDGSILAIASGREGLAWGEALQDSRIHLYSLASETVRTLDETGGAGELTWSPDGRWIAYSAGRLWILDLATGEQVAITRPFDVMHGLGPVWSPDGKRIAYQRSTFREQHEVVLVTPGNPFDVGTTPREDVLPAEQTTSDGASARVYPSRVTWSPDGEHLLYHAWSSPPGLGGILTVAPDGVGPAVVLDRTPGIVSYEGYPDTTQVSIQAWGREPSP